ncbi:MAG TPA: hypothetical protein VKV24_11610 [Casimicrobiaceae bacterium]|nr:hypothetical protein [Casimicrobiaceae bacterium]
MSQWRGGESQQGGGSQSGRQQSQQGGAQPLRARQLQSMAEVAVRGTALLWDVQMETARNLWRTQARTAAMFGVPDCSQFLHFEDDRARRLFSASAEQMLNAARQARETVVEVQRQLGRLAEQQTIGITEQVRAQMEQLGRSTEEGLREIEQIATAEADHAQEIAQEALDEEEQDEDRGHQLRDMSESASRNGDERAHSVEHAMQSATNGAQQAKNESEEQQASAQRNASGSRSHRETRRQEKRGRARR